MNVVWITLLLLASYAAQYPEINVPGSGEVECSMLFLGDSMYFSWLSKMLHDGGGVGYTYENKDYRSLGAVRVDVDVDVGRLRHHSVRQAGLNRYDPGNVGNVTWKDVCWVRMDSGVGSIQTSLKFHADVCYVQYGRWIYPAWKVDFNSAVGGCGVSEKDGTVDAEWTNERLKQLIQKEYMDMLDKVTTDERFDCKGWVLDEEPDNWSHPCLDETQREVVSERVKYEKASCLADLYGHDWVRNCSRDGSHIFQRFAHDYPKRPEVCSRLRLDTFLLLHCYSQIYDSRIKIVDGKKVWNSYISEKGNVIRINKKEVRFPREDYDNDVLEPEEMGFYSNITNVMINRKKRY